MLDIESSKNPKNALVHGVYAKDIVLPGEPEEQFRELYDGFHGELNPESPLEEEVVLDIARLHWLKRRAIQAAKGRVREERHSSSLDEFRYRVKYLEPLIRTLKQEIAPLESMRSILETMAEELPTSREIREIYEKCEAILSRIEREQHDYLVKVYCAIEGVSWGEDPVIERTYEPADLEAVMKVEAMIDTRIEKALARLARIKEFRRMYGSKALGS